MPGRDVGCGRNAWPAPAKARVKGVSTRDVEKVLAEFGIEGLSSTQVSRATAMLDVDLEAWRNRPLGRFRYIFLDARYEKTREHGVADDCAVLTAIGIDDFGRRRVLGVSIKVSKADLITQMVPLAATNP